MDSNTGLRQRLKVERVAGTSLAAASPATNLVTGFSAMSRHVLEDRLANRARFGVCRRRGGGTPPQLVEVLRWHWGSRESGSLDGVTCG